MNVTIAWCKDASEGLPVSVRKELNLNNIVLKLKPQKEYKIKIRIRKIIKSILKFVK